MSLFFVRRLSPTCFLFAAAAAAAQPASSPRMPGAPAPTDGLAYVSVFERYRGWDEQSVSSWRDVNRRVSEAAGDHHHAVHVHTPDQGTQDGPMPTPEPGLHDHHGAQP